MTTLPIIAVLLTTPVTPQPLSDTHMRDIGCVAVLGLIAYDQSRSAPLAMHHPDVRESGKRWAGIVGQRVMAQTGQPREVIALAISEAVKAEQNKSASFNTKDEAAGHAQARFDGCSALMQAQLAADAPLPKPVRR
jgi:hypothetical protein